MVFIVSTAAVLAEVITAKFLRAVSTKLSTFMVGNLNSPANLVKSKSVKGFLKVPLAYMAALLRTTKGVKVVGLNRFAAVHNEAQSCLRHTK